jgi:shikimate kinase|tara:strand:- start:1030 stop:1542 length:513 start_codon:yes stop_codon:yes gene_type:complete
MNCKGNYFLIGPMGAGKTSVGRHLAELIKLDFVDSDTEIEARTGVDIAYIFEKEGEEGFRRREKKIIDEISSREGVVLATGGGVIMDAENRKNLSSRGYVIYLYTNVKKQVERVKKGRERPLLTNKDPEKILKDLMEVRDPLYREIAECVITTNGRHINSIAKEIFDTLK